MNRRNFLKRACFPAAVAVVCPSAVIGAIVEGGAADEARRYIPYNPNVPVPPDFMKDIVVSEVPEYDAYAPIELKRILARHISYPRTPYPDGLYARLAEKKGFDFTIRVLKDEG